MRIYVDFNKKTITKIEQERPFFCGAEYTDVIRVLSETNVEATLSRYVTMNFTLPDGHTLGSYYHNATDTEMTSEGEILYYAYDFQIDTASGILKLPGQLSFTIVLNQPKADGSTAKYIIGNGTNPIVRTSVESNGDIYVVNGTVQTIVQSINSRLDTLANRLGQADADRADLRRLQSDKASKTYVDTKVSDLSTEIENKGYITDESLDGYATEDYVNENGGKIDEIYFNNEKLPITNKAVYINQEPYDDTELASQIEAVDDRVDATNQSLEALSDSVDELNNNLGTLETNVDSIDERLSEVEDDVIPTLADKQFVENLVNGKNRSVVISYAYSGNEFVTNNQVYKYVGGVFVNQSNPSDTKTPEVFFSDTLSLNLTVSKVYRVYQSASYPYSNVYELVDLTKLRLGDIIWIKETNVPDYWVSAVAFGNISLSKLETSKVDLTDYQSKITSTNKLSADLINENTNKSFVTSAEKATWNAKSNFSGDYNDLTNKPTIPTNISDLNDYWYVMSEINTAINASNVIQTITLNYDSVISVEPLTVLIDQETYTKAINPTTHLMNIDASPIGLFTGVIYRYAVYGEDETIVPYFSFFRDFNGYDLVFAQIDIDTLEVDGETKYAMQLSITPITNNGGGSAESVEPIDLTSVLFENGDFIQFPYIIKSSISDDEVLDKLLNGNAPIKLAMYHSTDSDGLVTDDDYNVFYFNKSYEEKSSSNDLIGAYGRLVHYTALVNFDFFKDFFRDFNDETNNIFKDNDYMMATIVVSDTGIVMLKIDSKQQIFNITQYIDSEHLEYTGQIQGTIDEEVCEELYTCNNPIIAINLPSIIYEWDDETQTEVPVEATIKCYARLYAELENNKIFNLVGWDISDFNGVINGTLILYSSGDFTVNIEEIGGSADTYTKEEIDEKLGDIESLLEAI